jgi:hypothetical protein
MRLAIAVLGCVLVSPGAHAFCGFFVAGSDAKLTNNASQVVLVRKGNRTVMSMSNNYQGPPEDFAMVVPVPVVLKKEDVRTLPHDVFDKIEALSAPRLVEYWEQDPCWKPEPVKYKKGRVYMESAPPTPSPAGAGYGVKIEAQFVVGEFQIVILSAKESGGLERWLRDNKYKIPDGAAAALAPYIREQSKFFVAKVDVKKVKRDAHGYAVLSPLRFAFDSNDLRLPVRLGLLNASGDQDLLVYVLSPTSRFEAANYKNVFIPTNLEVADEVRKSYGAFYAELFDQTMKQAGGKAVVTEYAWQTTSCDPCPVPPLTPSDLATLADEGTPPPSSDEVQQPQKKKMAPSVGPGGYFGDFSPWVLTRMHTRYSKATLSEDLLFREAKPAMGGRANWDGTSADQGATIADGQTNNFQGRYIIRHYWTGPVKCSDPVYNRWGGPPQSDGALGGAPQPEAARDLANAPRGKVALSKVVRSPVPSLGIAGQPPPKRGK